MLSSLNKHIYFDEGDFWFIHQRMREGKSILVSNYVCISQNFKNVLWVVTSYAKHLQCDENVWFYWNIYQQ